MPETTAKTPAKPRHSVAPAEATAIAVAPPCVMVICGATGDLTRRKLIPALYNLAHAKHLSSNFAIVGFAFDKFTLEAYREELTKDIQQFAGAPIDRELWDWFLQRIYYIHGDFRDAAVYQQLKELVLQADREQHC